MDRGWLLCDTTGVVGWFCLPSTGSPFGHHPRLRMVCPLWGQWVSTWRRFACFRPCISRKSVDTFTSSPPQQHPHRDTLASGGGAQCLTAGDARRVNPWRRGQRELRRRRRRTASVEGSSLLPLIVFSATISAPADTISLSAHILIVFSNTIRISTLTFLISTHLLQKKLKKSSEDSEDFQHN